MEEGAEETGLGALLVGARGPEEEAGFADFSAGAGPVGEVGESFGVVEEVVHKG